MSDSRKKVNVLTIAGSDPSSGAGLQGDLQTILAFGATPFSVVTAVTSQNTKEMKGVQSVDVDMVIDQLVAIAEDFSIHAIKMGLLPSPDCVEAVAKIVANQWHNIPIVIDPVLNSSTGKALVESGTHEAYIKHLLPIATLVTPNKMEAEILSGQSIGSLAEAGHAGRKLLESGVQACLVKGGHFTDDHATDVLLTKSECYEIKGESVKHYDVHGTGCALASAIACELARGSKLKIAVERGKNYITKAIQQSFSLGSGSRHLEHFPDLEQS